MEIAIQKLAMNLLIWLLRLLYDITYIFRQLAGLDEVDGTGTDLVSMFLNNPKVETVFINFLIISVLVGAVAMIVAIIKAFVNLHGGERKPISKITGQGVASIFISLLMAGIMMSGIFFSNSLLHEVNRAFNPGEESNICNDLFEISVDDKAYIMVPEYEYETEKTPTGETKIDPITGEPVYVYEKDEHGNYVYEKNADGSYATDDFGEKIKVKQKVYVTDSDGNIIYDSSGNPTPVIKSYTRKEITGKNGWTETGLQKKQDDTWCITQENADTVLGTYPHDLFNPFENPSKTPTMEGLIYYGSFNFFLGYLSTILVLVAMVSACLGLVKRLFDLVFLFLILPLISSTIPLDDGARFKVWRETVISKVILAYGAVFAVNTFMIMLPIITELVANKIIRMLLVVGGGLCISGGMLLIARVFGTDAAEGRELAQSARTLLAGAGAGVAGIKGTFNRANSARKWAFGVNDEKNAERRKLGAFRRFGGFMKKTGAAVGNGVKNFFGNSGASAALTPQSQPGSQLGQIMQRPRDALGRYRKLTDAERAARDAAKAGVKK